MNSPFTLKGQVLKGHPPIIGGDGGSVFLTRNGYIEAYTPDDFGQRIEEGLYFSIEMQSDSLEEQVLLGTGVTDRTALRIRLHADGVPHRVEMMVRDDDGNVLAGYAETSISRAKQLLCTADPRSNLLAFYEIQPWANNHLQTHYTKQDGPIRFSNLMHPLIIGGWNVDGQRQGHFVGRIGDVQTGLQWYSKSAADKLKKDFKNPAANPTNLPQIGQVSLPDFEQLRRLHYDIKRLQKISQKPLMEYDDLYDAAIILYRWFLDEKPMIKRACAAYGIQLWFYGQSGVEKNYTDAVLTDAPRFYFKASRGSHKPFGFKWVPLDVFINESSLFPDNKPISHEYFIKFVRDKYGAGHYDKNRTVDQRKLEELANTLQFTTQNVLYHHMQQLVRGVMESLMACGVLKTIQLDFNEKSS